MELFKFMLFAFANGAARDALVNPCCLAKNVDGFNILNKNTVIGFCCRSYIQLKLSQVNILEFLLIDWPISQHYVDKLQSVTLTLNRKNRITTFSLDY